MNIQQQVLIPLGILSAMLLFPMMATGQGEIRISAGINSSQYTTDFRDSEFQSELGYQFGADLQLGNKWYFQTGLHFEFMRNSMERNGNPLEDIKVSRLRVPFYVGHSFLERSAFLNLRIFTGPNASLVVNSSLDESLDIEREDIKNFLYGWNIGAGVDVAFFFVDVGYMFGMNNVFDIEDSSSSNNLFFLNGGLRIKF